MVAIAKNSIPVFNSNSRVFNSNSIFNSTNVNSNSNSRIGIGIELQFQFQNWIDPNPANSPHNTPHIPSCFNNEQTTKQTKAINNSYLMWMWHKPCRTLDPWCPCIETRCLSNNWITSPIGWNNKMYRNTPKHQFIVPTTRRLISSVFK